jgi:hypothetical protein
VKISNETYYSDFETGYRRDDAKALCKTKHAPDHGPMTLLHFEDDLFNQKWKNINKWLVDNG